MLKTTFKQKIALIFFGLALTLVLLEVGLRIGGFVFLSLQEYHNRVSLIHNGEYRILCLGESTTALGGESSYPRQLEQILNASQDDIKFTVINKGIPSITTSHIVTHINQYLEEYKPHMVVTMMGINDGLTSKEESVSSQRWWSKVFVNTRIYKLGQSLRQHLAQKRKEIKDVRINEKLDKMKKKIEKKPTAEGYAALSSLYRISNRFDQEKQCIIKALALNPKDYIPWGYLGLYYKRRGEYDQAIAAFTKMVQFSPSEGEPKVAAYADLAECYWLKEDYPMAERTYLEAIQYLPNHPGAYGCLGELYLQLKKYDEAEQLFVKQLQINPSAVLFYGKLAHCYRRKGLNATAENLLEQAIQLNPQAGSLYVELGYCLLDNQKYAQAETVLKRAVELNSKNFNDVDVEIYTHLLRSYEGQNKEREAEKLRATMKAQQENYIPKTKDNYQELKKVLFSKNIPLVAVQYPLRSIDSIKKMVESSGHVMFVDNQASFKKAIAQEGYDEYFVDRFAGDFGHCSPQGNHLLASNIVDVILKKLKPAR